MKKSKKANRPDHMRAERFIYKKKEKEQKRKEDARRIHDIV